MVATPGLIPRQWHQHKHKQNIGPNSWTRNGVCERNCPFAPSHRTMEAREAPGRCPRRIGADKRVQSSGQDPFERLLQNLGSGSLCESSRPSARPPPPPPVSSAPSPCAPRAARPARRRLDRRGSWPVGAREIAACPCQGWRRGLDLARLGFVETRSRAKPLGDGEA